MLRFTVLWGALISLAAVASAADPDTAYNRLWAEKAFSFQLVSHLSITHEDVIGDTKPGLCSGKGPLPIRLGDKVYQHGIGVNSQSTLRVSLDRPAKKIQAIIGLDRNVDKTAASIRFHVRIREKDAFVTEIMRSGCQPLSIDVPLSGAREFDLIVDDAGDGRGWDQGDWADAKVVLEDGSEQWLDDLPMNDSLPFSFVYGGKHSSEFINSWKTNIVDDELSTTIHRRTLTATDPQTGLEVRAVCLIYQDTAGVDWTVYFTNKGSKDTPVIEQVKAIDVSVLHTVTAETVLHRLNGAPCKTDDWMPFDQPLQDGQRIEFSATNGRSSNVSPWFTTDWGNGGVITAIGWSGQWSAAVESKGNQTHIEAGIQNLHTILHPGESLRSPRILQLHWQGNDSYYAYNQFRQTMFAHIMPRINGQIVVPPITHLSTSFYEQNDTTETNLLSHLESIRGLGFEMFWLDAYWTGPNGFPDSMGNYGFPLERVEPIDRFLHGLSAIADAVEKENLRFLLWFEPERVAKGTLLTKEHPEWVLSPSGDGSGLFNLGIPEARQFMTKYLNAAIIKYKLSCLRIDYNIDPLPFWQFMDAKDPNRIGMTEMRYMEGLYRMWDDILAANPKLFIDNCASGGRRIDVETMSRSIPLWRSDNTCDMLDLKPATVLLAAVKNQIMSTGLNRYVPFSLVGQKGATPYLFRSGYNGGIDIADDLRPKEYPRDLLKQGIAEAKRLRKYFFGNFYPLYEAGTSPREWCVMQYHRTGENDGMIMAFRREQSPFRTFECQLREIDPAAGYEVTLSHTYQSENPATMKGSDLQNLKIDITEAPGSVIIEYRLIK